MTNLKNIFIILILSGSFLFSQVSNVKINDNIYDFLSITSKKGFIEYNDLVKPLSRKYIAQKLIEIKEVENKLTKLQKDELEFYFKEFGYEIEKIIRIKKSELEIQNSNLNKENQELTTKNQEQKLNVKKQKNKKRSLTDKSWEFEVRTPKGKEKEEENKATIEVEKWGSIDWKKREEEITFFKKDTYKRFRFFSYENKYSYINVNPIIGYEIANWEKSNYQNVFLGINFYGEFGSILGFNFELKQIRESPRVRNFLYNKYANKTAIDLQLADAERLEYATVNVDLGVDWEWGSFTIGKNHLNWGYGESGKIVLSSRAPSFPYIRLSITPTDWFSFNYIHGWLNSDVVDTNGFYSTWRSKEWGRTDRLTYIQKFIALHSVTFKLYKGLELSMGESVIYADNLQIAYLIPIMFFDLADEYLNRNDNYAGASTQLFLSLSSRNNIKNTHLYANFHADELTPEGLFDPKTQYYKFAFTFGGSVIDLPINNLGLKLEYTKVYPGNYRHFIPTLTYESSSSLLGHWMGDNADLVYAALDYTIIRGLKIKLWGQYIRKGTEALGNRAYKIQIPQPGFLFIDNIRDRINYTYYGIDAEYEIIHDLWIKAHYQYINYEQQISEGEFNSTLYRDIAVSFGYGI